MKIGVFGIPGDKDNTYDDFAHVAKVLDDYRASVSLLISGGGRGVETLTQRYAEANAIPFRLVRPVPMPNNFTFVARNQIIINESDLLLVIWDGTTSFLSYTISQITSSKKTVIVVPVKHA